MPSFAPGAQNGDGGRHDDKYTGKQEDREIGEETVHLMSEYVMEVRSGRGHVGAIRQRLPAPQPRITRMEPTEESP